MMQGIFEPTTRAAIIVFPAQGETQLKQLRAYATITQALAICGNLLKMISFLEVRSTCFKQR